MDTIVMVIVIAVVVIAAAALAFAYQRRRSGQLQERFGPEYERTIDESGDRRAAERELRGRERRVSKLDIHPLSGESAQRYRAEWNTLQQSFVDEPNTAVDEADRLVIRIMREEGYPVDEFDQRANDISVDHPEVALHYREAHRVAVARTKGEADTEDLRQAVTEYRQLVDVLLADRTEGGGDHRTMPTDGVRREQPGADGQQTPGSRNDNA
jgi:hypothetical protein